MRKYTQIWWIEMEIYECLIKVAERHGTAGADNAYGHMANSVAVEDSKTIASGGMLPVFLHYGGKRSAKRNFTEGVVVFPSGANQKTLNDLLSFLNGGDGTDFVWKAGYFVKKATLKPEGYGFDENSLCVALTAINREKLMLTVRNIAGRLGLDYVWVKVTNKKRRTCEMCKVACLDEGLKARLKDKQR